MTISSQSQWLTDRPQQTDRRRYYLSKRFPNGRCWPVPGFGFAASKPKSPTSPPLIVFVCSAVNSSAGFGKSLILVRLVPVFFVVFGMIRFLLKNKSPRERRLRFNGKKEISLNRPASYYRGAGCQERVSIGTGSIYAIKTTNRCVLRFAFNVRHQHAPSLIQRR